MTTRPLITRGAWVMVKGLIRIGGHDAPDLLTIARIQGHKPAVESADVNLALPGRDAAIDHVAAAVDAKSAGYGRIVGPKQSAGFGVVTL